MYGLIQCRSVRNGDTRKLPLVSPTEEPRSILRIRSPTLSGQTLMGGQQLHSPRCLVSRSSNSLSCARGASRGGGRTRAPVVRSLMCHVCGFGYPNSPVERRSFGVTMSSQLSVGRWGMYLYYAFGNNVTQLQQLTFLLELLRKYLPNGEHRPTTGEWRRTRRTAGKCHSRIHPGHTRERVDGNPP